MAMLNNHGYFPWLYRWCAYEKTVGVHQAAVESPGLATCSRAPKVWSRPEDREKCLFYHHKMVVLSIKHMGLGVEDLSISSDEPETTDLPVSVPVKLPFNHWKWRKCTCWVPWEPPQGNQLGFSGFSANTLLGKYDPFQVIPSPSWLKSHWSVTPQPYSTILHPSSG